MGDAQTNKLYVNLIALSEGNIFALLPEIMQKLLDNPYCDTNNSENSIETFNILLPSDNDWQTKVYYKLVEKQRLVDAQQDEGEEKAEKPTTINVNDSVESPDTQEIQEKAINSRQSSLKSSTAAATSWSVSDISKAGCLLNIRQINVDFEDEQEMRRVYTLIYNVFRYKNIMMHALNDVGFFQNFPQLNYNQSHVWLLLYDLYCRNFKKRDTKSSLLVKSLFDKVELLETENALWEKRVKIAASIARLRIENRALSLSDLLPNHLSNERVSGIGDNLPVSCWINTRKVKDPSEICRQIETTFSLEITNEHNLLENQYKWDEYCPNMLIFPSTLRTDLARSLFIKQHKLIIQDRSFCLGPTVFCQILNELELTGNVIQTHMNSPRCSAYLANILKRNDKINKLIIFNANNRRLEYEHYFKQLNINNVVVLADKLTDMALGSNDMEEVVAIYATPPNSYSAVKDPIDLVCGRGGDLTMLEILTESDDNKESKQRVCKILNDQKNTLMSSMSRPQVQFVLYETHSEFDLENNEMVHKTVDEINQIAKLHHATLQGKILTNSDKLQEINNNEEKLEVSVTGSDEFEEPDSDEDLLNIEVPETDIFDVVDLSNENFQNDGCFLALLQRRNVIRLDNKYMIQMAENRGLFGQTTSPTARDKPTKNPRRKHEPNKPKKTKIKRQLKEDEILRIATPTHTFLRHTRPIHQIIDCPKYQMKRNEFVYKQWWSEVFYYLFKLKKSMEKNKIVPPDMVNGDINPTVFINALLRSRMQIDEVAADNRKRNRLILPKLRLTRCAPKKKILKLPLNVTFIGDKCI